MTTAASESVLTGMGMVIDDHARVGSAEEDLIVDLLAQIREAKIPFVLYETLPPPEVYRHLSNVAFILLDWELWEKPSSDSIMEGVNLGAEAQRQGIKANIDFLKGLKETCFAPVFIFSHLDPESIKTELRNAELLGADENHTFIMVRTKSDLKRTEQRQSHPMLEEVKAWVESNPSIYVLSHWKEAVSSSQNQLFWDLYGKHPAWPSVLWETYGAEGDDPEQGLADILLRNMRARLIPLSLKPEFVIPPGLRPPDCATIQAVLEASMIVPDESLPAHLFGCGDLFKGANQRYWINIRCDCDCLPRGCANPSDITLYLLEASRLSDRQFRQEWFMKEGLGLVQINASCHVLFPVGGKALRVNFKELLQVPVGKLPEIGVTQRIGRLAAPYITQIRQRFALHLQREGLPRIPDSAVRDE